MYVTEITLDFDMIGIEICPRFEGHTKRCQNYLLTVFGKDGSYEDTLSTGSLRMFIWHIVLSVQYQTRTLINVH